MGDQLGVLVGVSRHDIVYAVLVFGFVGYPPGQRNDYKLSAIPLRGHVRVTQILLQMPRPVSLEHHGPGPADVQSYQRPMLLLSMMLVGGHARTKQLPLFRWRRGRWMVLANCRRPVLHLSDAPIWALVSSTPGSGQRDSREHTRQVQHLVSGAA
jgi:hypothetical protein